MPLTTTDMLNGFVAMDGMLTLVLGISIAQIKEINAVNLLPCPNTDLAVLMDV